MSWSAQGTVKDGVIGFDSKSGIEGNPVHEEQFEEAVSLAAQAIVDGVLGSVEDYDFTFNVSGHGNPRHEPTAGWANDALTINIYQTPRVEAVEEDKA